MHRLSAVKKVHNGNEICVGEVPKSTMIAQMSSDDYPAQILVQHLVQHLHGQVSQYQLAAAEVTPQLLQHFLHRIIW